MSPRDVGDPVVSRVVAADAGPDMSELVEIGERRHLPASRNTKARAGARASEGGQDEPAPRKRSYALAPAPARRQAAMPRACRPYSPSPQSALFGARAFSVSGPPVCSRDVARSLDRSLSRPESGSAARTFALSGRRVPTIRTNFRAPPSSIPRTLSPSRRLQPVRLCRRGRPAVRRSRIQVRPALAHPVAEPVEVRAAPAHRVALQRAMRDPEQGRRLLHVHEFRLDYPHPTLPRSGPWRAPRVPDQGCQPRVRRPGLQKNRLGDFHGLRGICALPCPGARY